MDHSNEKWGMSGRIIFCFENPGGEAAILCELSEPRGSRYVEHKPLGLGSKDSAEAYSRGHLIIAAPKLLKACIEALKFLDDPEPTLSQADKLGAILEDAVTSARKGVE